MIDANQLSGLTSGQTSDQVHGQTSGQAPGLAPSQASGQAPGLSHFGGAGSSSGQVSGGAGQTFGVASHPPLTQESGSRPFIMMNNQDVDPQNMTDEALHKVIFNLVKKHQLFNITQGGVAIPAHEYEQLVAVVHERAFRMGTKVSREYYTNKWLEAARELRDRLGVWPPIDTNYPNALTKDDVDSVFAMAYMAAYKDLANENTITNAEASVSQYDTINVFATPMQANEGGAIAKAAIDNVTHLSSISSLLEAKLPALHLILEPVQMLLQEFHDNHARVNPVHIDKLRDLINDPTLDIDSDIRERGVSVAQVLRETADRDSNRIRKRDLQPFHDLLVARIESLRLQAGLMGEVI